MSEIKIKKYPTIDEAHRNGDYFAINTSDGGNKRPLGNLVLGIRSSDGRTTSILLPATWIPIDLRTYARPEDLVNAASIRENMRTGALAIVPKETVDVLVNHPAYANEAKVVAEKMASFNFGGGGNDGATEMSLNISKNELAFGFGNQGNGDMTISATPLTEMILNSGNDETLIRNFNTNMHGLSLGEYAYIQQKAKVGSLTQLIAMELSASMMSGGIQIKTVEETEAYKEAAQRGIRQAPTFT